MKYLKMKKTIAVVGIAALLACPNGALTVMAEEMGTETQEETKEETTAEKELLQETSETETTEENDNTESTTENGDNAEGKEEVSEESLSGLSNMTSYAANMLEEGKNRIALIDNGLEEAKNGTIQAATDLQWNEKTGQASFTNPNDNGFSYYVKIYRDVTNKPWEYSWTDWVGPKSTGTIDLFNKITEPGEYYFQVYFKSDDGDIQSEMSNVWNYTKKEPLPTPIVAKVEEGVVSCELSAELPVLHFGYQLKKGDDIIETFGGSHDVGKKENKEEMNVIGFLNTTYHANISIDARYDYFVRVCAKSSDLTSRSESGYSDWIKIYEATESFDDDDDDDDDDEPTVSEPSWIPTTPEEIERFSVVGKEEVKYTAADSSYPVEVANAVQGPKCFDSFNAVRGDFTIGRTFNILPQGKYIYRTDSKARITITIPKALQAAGREYKMICVTENGLPVELTDIDSAADTITFETDTYYAFALVYKDSAAK